MNLNFHYINLDKRPERELLFEKTWLPHGRPLRVQAIDLSKSEQGTLGCYLSHKRAFEQIPQPPHQILNFHIICEDDAVPCSDFKDRLIKIIGEMPNDCDILMLGYSITKNSKFTKVSELVSKADKYVLAGHCYLVNPAFYKTMQDLHNRIGTKEKPFDNFDLMLNYLQQNHNVYMAMPAMAYQYNSYSDNSNRIVGNTHFTETFFKDKL